MVQFYIRRKRKSLLRIHTDDKISSFLKALKTRFILRISYGWWLRTPRRAPPPSPPSSPALPSAASAAPTSPPPCPTGTGPSSTCRGASPPGTQGWTLPPTRRGGGRAGEQSSTLGTTTTPMTSGNLMHFEPEISEESLQFPPFILRVGSLTKLERPRGWGCFRWGSCLSR